jgi:hypothetical protein
MNPISPTSTDGVTNRAVRAWLRIESLAILILSLVLYRATGAPWWLFFALLLVPDLSLFSFLVNPAIGSRVYNTVHSYALPVVLAVTAFLTHHAEALPYALIWATHLAMDRALGYGLKYPEAFGRTHLGVLGMRPDPAAISKSA